MATETHEHRIKRMKMRSMRRGIKEMDIVLSAYAEDQLAGMSVAELDLYDALLEENDQDLLTWITGQIAPPESLASLIHAISAHAMRAK
ncbi:MAG: succinate dehydrogenase assembly factor 2 [Paracoccaceae bacterium]